MTDAFDSYFFSSNLSSYSCPALNNLECQPPAACARESSTGNEYCCDAGDVCWRFASKCQTDGSTLSCGNGDNTWCCLYPSEICTQTSGQINICWSTAHDTLTNISLSTLNQTYLSLSSASPSASSWSFSPEKLIAATATTTTSTSTSTTKHTAMTTDTHSSTTSATPSSTTSPSSSSSLSGGAIAGIVIGAVAGVVIIVALLLYLFRRRRGQGDTPTGNAHHENVVYGSEPKHEVKLQPTSRYPQGPMHELASAQRTELPTNTPQELPGS
ncbi:hypothetical protein BGW36DRAFT_58296 [Talaromyces proteolyticus]|uniref:Mid2 domain-containing protein n=1 Tax=Talaromyces proteolyticus TaxID=1131652 RepID=A0AAD4KGJ5_9EURO|nr:uncharacterized protein BGW36DRAFT_58296 [Talaromyces proteolyticus]KAH8690650.1 hypothetical protein BGW36DRAFT_58296 [Talaromyces proteolyticus]